MNTIMVMSLVALATTGLALIHETRLCRAARSVACHLLQALHHNSKAHDHARDGK
jgi:hypothetical protein